MGDSYSEELYSSGDNLGDQHLNKRNSPVSDSSEEIRKAAEECLLSSSSTLDVSRKNIKHLTEEMYRLPNIKYLHLEGNVISTLPEDLFQKLPHLVWLDLRYNKIKALPPGIGFHRQLKTLLLERNPIKELPAELGTPPVEKPNLSELLQSSLDLSQEWPNKEERRRFQELRAEAIRKEEEELLAEGRAGAAPGGSAAGSRLPQKAQLYPRSAGPARTLQVKRVEKCRSAAEKELKKERALFDQRKKYSKKHHVLPITAVTTS
ncbi:leucine-rich repeat-containing protein 27 isoform X3 [Strigops habroptila]|uniref:leucine-rich repeat-containing protein 27 isoform X3 n=1 Tax=Strigops habroptila TaxID=2489341 RepID=UPI0011CF4AC1|nr:leucine-rich repeat-containing protein 27 isoform X3 [Strigops habroptila]